MARKLDRSAVATLGRIGTTPDDVCGRILSARLAADAETEAAGLSWYAEGRRVARELADRLGAPVEVGAGILAAYSPRTPWRVNVELAWEHARDGWAAGALSAHALKAAAVVDAWRQGADPGEVLAGCARILADARRVGSGFVGWWTDGDTGTLWLDVVDVVPVGQAGALARERGELAYWDAGAGAEVRVA